MSRAAIGVFDSGVGGLSVLREIRVALPNEDLFYVADSGAAPYGDRPEAFIRDRVHVIVEFFRQKGVKAIVVACNTATAVAVRMARSRFAIPMVAMEPAVKPAAQLTRSGVIGVLATSRTLASESFARLAGNFGKGMQIILQPCPGLVEQVEKGELASERTLSLMTGYVSSLLDQGADTIVLGCTHYPFLLPVIQAVAGPNVRVVDAGAAVARQLYRRLKASELLSCSSVRGTEQFWTSGVPDHVEPVVSQLWGERVLVQFLPELSS